jgi:hypothetical protein
MHWRDAQPRLNHFFEFVRTVGKVSAAAPQSS